MTLNTLICATELNQIIDDPDLRLFDCRFYLTEPKKGLDDYSKGHVLNSQYADLNNQLAGPISSNTGRHPLPDKAVFQNQLRKWGIDKNSQIVVYDDASGAIAARLWWMCLWAGLENVRVLDGGLQAWIEKGFELTKEFIEYNKTDFIANYDDKFWVSTKDIEISINKADTVLTDARANIRYRGEQEPIDPIAGHVPGAINLPFDQNLDADGCFLDQEALYKLHQEHSQTISMCGSGVTACHNMLARAHAGLNIGKLYVGSWSEWITDSTRPIEKT